MNLFDLIEKADFDAAAANGMQVIYRSGREETPDA